MSILIGFFIMFVGYLVIRKKALFLVNIVLWNGVSGGEKLSKIFGAILLAAGFAGILLPFLMK